MGSTLDVDGFAWFGFSGLSRGPGRGADFVLVVSCPRRSDIRGLCHLPEHER